MDYIKMQEKLNKITQAVKEYHTKTGEHPNDNLIKVYVDRQLKEINTNEVLKMGVRKYGREEDLNMHLSVDNIVKFDEELVITDRKDEIGSFSTKKFDFEEWSIGTSDNKYIFDGVTRIRLIIPDGEKRHEYVYKYDCVFEKVVKLEDVTEYYTKYKYDCVFEKGQLKEFTSYKRKFDWEEYYLIINKQIIDDQKVVKTVTRIIDDGIDIEYETQNGVQHGMQIIRGYSAEFPKKYSYFDKGVKKYSLYYNNKGFASKGEIYADDKTITLDTEKPDYHKLALEMLTTLNTVAKKYGITIESPAVLL